MGAVIPPVIWLALALVLFVTVTCVLKTLALLTRRQLEIHDLVRQSTNMRRQYVELMMRRRAMGQNVVPEGDEDVPAY